MADDTVYKEFDRLKKSDLLEIFISGKVPETIKLSENARRIVENSENCKLFDDSLYSDQISKLRLEISKLKCDLKCATIEIDYLKVVNRELVKGNERQDLIITLLQSKHLDSDKQNNCDVAKPVKCISHSGVQSRSTEENKIINSKNKNVKKVDENKIDTVISSQHRIGSSNTVQTKILRSKSTSSCPAVETDELKKTQENIMKSIVNLDEDIKSNQEKWETVTTRNKRRRQVVVGTGTEGIAGTVKGVPKFTDLHVYRVDPKTDVATMEGLLKPHFPEVMCESMASRYPDLYASFKVRIYQENFRKAMDPSLWPKNACVNNFLYLRKNSQSQR